MPKDIQTPPGTGHAGTMTPDQKVLLKEMWAQIFSIADSDASSVSNDALASAAANEAGSETASVKSKTATKKGWFGTTKSVPVPAADETPLSRANLADIGLSVEQLRPALWNNILGDHPGTEHFSVIFFAISGELLFCVPEWMALCAVFVVCWLLRLFCVHVCVCAQTTKAKDHANCPSFLCPDSAHSTP